MLVIATTPFIMVSIGTLPFHGANQNNLYPLLAMTTKFFHSILVMIAGTLSFLLMRQLQKALCLLTTVTTTKHLICGYPSTSESIFDDYS